MSGILYIVATPIGNLEDITLRALRILRECDFVLAEDTRVTKRLLDHYEIKKELISFHEHSRLTKVDFILRELGEGKQIALVTDAGTPGISDPGQKLIQHVKYVLHETKIIPIPGPSAVVAALSVSGFPTDEFRFLGYPPHKKGREKFFRMMNSMEETIVFYESPHRILKAISQLQKFIAPERQIMIGRELTKVFETVYRGIVREIHEKLPKDEVRGEFVVVLGKV